MDLAKIRKKSLQSLREPDAASFAAPFSSPGLASNGIETVPAVTDPAAAAPVFFQKESHHVPAESVDAVVPSITAILPGRVTATQSPLEAILAGRAAAGCDNESSRADDETSQMTAESCHEFLCFRVSDEIYGINIMDLKEIIKPREVTEVPRAPLFISGILSLRGTIIPIIDMRVRLGLARKEPTGKERIIVIRNNNSLSGLLVDEVIQVVQVELDDVEAAPAVLDGIDRDFISGLGRSGGRLIIILNLGTIADINLN
ncbi:MAG: chemotaxis protein CheW [Desulfuromonadaceae bacterium]|nr:chemotaxis protein CheW [Desulfuromonadaceae bacterium]